jgi:hypothetical protein
MIQEKYNPLRYQKMECMKTLFDMRSLLRNNVLNGVMALSMCVCVEAYTLHICTHINLLRKKPLGD